MDIEDVLLIIWAYCHSCQYELEIKLRKGGYAGDSIVEYNRGFKGDARSLDYVLYSPGKLQPMEENGGSIWVGWMLFSGHGCKFENSKSLRSPEVLHKSCIFRSLMQTFLLYILRSHPCA